MREGDIEVREGDIEALRRKLKDEGRPIKSNIIIKKDGTKIYYNVKKGKVNILDK